MTEPDTMGSLIAGLRLQIDSGTHLPGSKVLVDEEVYLHTLENIRMAYEGEMQAARWTVEHRQEVLAEAGAEAEALIAEARMRVAAMLSDVGMRAAAQEQMERILSEARARAEESRDSSWDHTLDRLSHVDQSLHEISERVTEAKRNLRPSD